jgi:type I restriction enzyme S subunit
MSEPLNPLKGKDDVLANGWRETTLADLCTDISYGYTESAKQKKVGPKFLRITDIASGRLDWKNVPYCPINESDFEKYKLLPGDIVIARTGATTGANYTIKKSDPKDVVFASYLIRYKINPQIANPYYIGQLLRSPNWSDYVDAIAGGSAQPGANAKQLGSFDILLPPLPEQKAIAEVLSRLDDKIDLLHRQNKTLEQMAETLFRQWFVEEADEGWEEKPLSDFGQIICGKTPSKKKSEYFDGEYPFIKIPDMHGKTFVLDTQDSLSEEGFLSQKKKALPPKSINVSCIATVGLVTMNAFPSQTNQQINSIIPKERYRYYLYCEMKNSYDLLHSMASGGTATLNLNTGNFSKIPVLKPDEDSLERFNHLVIPMFVKVFKNQTQIRTLEKMRDTLLPKLMSGKVRVKMEE